MPAQRITPLKRALILQLAPIYTDKAIADVLGEKPNTIKWHRTNEPKLSHGQLAIDKLASFAIREAIAQAHVGSLEAAANALEAAANSLRKQAKQPTNP